MRHHFPDRSAINLFYDDSVSSSREPTFSISPYVFPDSPTGICGRYSKRQIIDSFLKVTPLWEKGPDGQLAINVPGVDCLMGIGEGDVFYCQHCPGLCDGDLVPDGNNATGFAWTF